MPYVVRNVQGQIESVHRAAQPGAEFVPEGHPDLAAFLGETAAAPKFEQLDADFVRVIEDVIDTLIVRHVINITDLPDEAQAKLFARKSFRERISKSSLQLFQKTDFGDVI